MSQAYPRPLSAIPEPAISILLPARNAARTLYPALRSVLQQSFGDFEILLLDDGSTDNTSAIAMDCSDARVRVLSDGRALGLAARLNQGIDVARGRYLARMDADDVSFPERLALQVAFLDAHPEVDLLGCRAIVFRDDGHIIGLLPFAGTHEALCARPWRGIPLPHPGWMGRREWFVRHRYCSPEVLRAEDQELLLRAAPSSRYACLDEVLLGYRQGRFGLRRTLLARRSLLAAQCSLFRARRQWGNLAKACGLTAVKLVVDGCAALPGGEALFFRRMSAPPPATAIATLHACLHPDASPSP